jgi:hypothetical protein
MDTGIIETLVQPPWRPVVADLSSGARSGNATTEARNRQHENRTRPSWGEPPAAARLDSADERDETAQARDLVAGRP